MPKYQLTPEKYHFCDICLERSMFFGETKIGKKVTVNILTTLFSPARFTHVLRSSFTFELVTAPSATVQNKQKVLSKYSL